MTLPIETLVKIQDTAVAAAGAVNKIQILSLPHDPNNFAIVGPDGLVSFRAVAPGPRVHKLGGLDQVAEFVKHVTDDLSGTPVVWYDAEGVIVLIDNGNESRRTDRGQLLFTPTRTYRQLTTLGDKWLPQKEFIRLLRVTLADAATESSVQLLRVARVLAFSSSTTGHGKVELGRQSLGRDIEEEVKSEVGELPEEVTFNVRIFTDPSLTRRFAVRCAVDVNAREGTFNLCPLAEELETAMDEQLALIGDELESNVTCPVFCGKP